MKAYDLIFGLGAGCSVSQSLRDAGLQFASYPLDWIAAPGIMQGVEAIERGFEGWFEREDLKLWDVRHEEGAVQRVYFNTRTRYGFAHEFTNSRPFDRFFDEVKAKYLRRAERFMKALGEAKNALAIYHDLSTRPRIPDETLAEARRRLMAKFPGLGLDLLYVYEDPSAKELEAVSDKDGVTVLRGHYAKFLDGKVMHTVDRSQLVRYIHENFTIAGHDDIAGEKARYEAEQKKLRKLHWGRGRVEQWVNRKLFKTYRRLQDYLIAQRLIPGDRPCWFEESDKVWPYGPVPERG